ncbi:MAG: hypothetical protein IT320_21535 [Anaerolineae bacterium]|nr:hypothetical protein [Anaerolineae bacterium]
MRRLHILLTLSSLTVVLVSIERFSPTTQILLQPDDFLRLHELVQMTTLILFTVIIPAFVLQHLTDNFSLLRSRTGAALGLLFLVGVYFYATGNGLHEVASFLFNQYCPPEDFDSAICKSLFIDDYYAGNILYFIGAWAFTVPLLIFEQMRPHDRMSGTDIVLVVINGLFFALAVVAYAGFDRVLVGFVFSAIMLITAVVLFVLARRSYRTLPYTFYTIFVYALGLAGSIIVRLR